ncbi:MAG: hypothetical protein LM549_09905 [Candidatus Competibacter sp.]|nr:hypothetical protein [Candidatus Competibacter sp.]
MRLIKIRRIDSAILTRILARWRSVPIPLVLPHLALLYHYVVGYQAQWDKLLLVVSSNPILPNARGETDFGSFLQLSGQIST